MSQLIDQRHVGVTTEHGVEVHLFESRSPVLHDPPRNDLEALDQLLGALPSVAFNEPDGNIGAPLAAPMSFAQHGVGLADSGGRAQVDAEPSGGVDGW